MCIRDRDDKEVGQEDLENIEDGNDNNVEDGDDENNDINSDNETIDDISNNDEESDDEEECDDDEPCCPECHHQHNDLLGHCEKLVKLVNWKPLTPDIDCSLCSRPMEPGEAILACTYCCFAKCSECIRGGGQGARLTRSEMETDLKI